MKVMMEAHMRSLIRLPAGLTGCALVLAMLPGPAAGQDIETLPIPILEVSAGYTYMHDTGLEETFPVGWYLSGAVNVTQWFGIVAEGGGSFGFRVVLGRSGGDHGRSLRLFLNHSRRRHWSRDNSFLWRCRGWG